MVKVVPPREGVRKAGVYGDVGAERCGLGGFGEPPQERRKSRQETDLDRSSHASCPVMLLALQKSLFEFTYIAEAR